MQALDWKDAEPDASSRWLLTIPAAVRRAWLMAGRLKRPDTSWLIVANWVSHKSALAGGDRMQFNQLKRRCFAPPR